jgi:hypothetical protein
MNDKNNLEYLFWLESWSDGSSVFPVYGKYKCIVNKSMLRIIESEKYFSDDLVVSIRSITNCKISYPVRGPKISVKIEYNKNRIELFPVNPVDPFHVLYTNQDEVKALVDLINALRLNLGVEAQTNPFKRQLASKSSVVKMKQLDENFNVLNSPWEYYASYGEKNIVLKIVLGIVIGFAGAISIIIGISYLVCLFSK